MAITHDLNQIVDVVVQISPMAAPRKTFNQALIVGSSSSIIPATDIYRIYENLDAVAADGFATDSPEYKAASLYFSQSPAPRKLLIGTTQLNSITGYAVNQTGSGYAAGNILSVGNGGAKFRVDAVTSAGGVKTAAVATGGTGYNVDDILTVVGGSGTGCTLKVAEVNSGAVTAVTVDNAGSGYSTATNLETSVTPEGGTGCKINITAVSAAGEIDQLTMIDGGVGYALAIGLPTTVTPAGGTGCTLDITNVGAASLVAAVRYIREANADWYAVSCLDAVKTDILAVAEYIETATPSSVFFYTTSDATVFDALKALKRKRSIGQYSTTNAYAAVSIMGYAMGANTGLANSAFTLKFKREPGVQSEPLTATQVYNIEQSNGNVYINYGNYYDLFEQGVMADGSFFDELINLDMLVNNIQLNVMDLLYANTKVPLTDPGVTQIIHACNQACDVALTVGFLAPGTWNGPQVLKLNPGDVLPTGYLVQAPSVSTLTPADRSARKSPPIYVCILEAGAVHSITIGVYVSR